MKRSSPSHSPSMFPAVIISLLAHGLFVVAVLMSTTLFESDIEMATETPVMVEFVTETTARPKPKKEDPKPEEDIPPPLDEKPQPAPKALEQPKPETEKAEKVEEAPVERIKPAEPVKKPQEPKKEPEKPKETVKPKPEPPKNPRKRSLKKPKKKIQAQGLHRF